MPPVNLPVELIVRVEPGARAAFGSGFLVGDSHVLTCAHVVEPGFMKVSYVDPSISGEALSSINDRHENNAALKLRLRGRTVTVVTYDGEERAAELVEIHSNEDLVLLKLRKPLPHPIVPLPFHVGEAAIGQPDMAGFGFRRTGEDAYAIRRVPLGTMVSDSAVFAATGSAMRGEVSEGMSGGPVLALLSGDRLRIVGMITMGGSAQTSSMAHRADLLSAFLHSSFASPAAGPPAEADPGLAPKWTLDSGGSTPMERWLRLPGATGAGDGVGERAVRFIAAWPITFGDLDAATGAKTDDRTSSNRAAFFAPMTIGEARAAARLIAEKLGADIRLPDPRAQADFWRLADASPGEDAIPEALRDQRCADPLLAPEWKPKSAMRRGAAVFPPDDAPEWVLDGEKGRLALAGSRKPDREIADPSGSDADMRALLRPMLTIPVWAVGS